MKHSIKTAGKVAEGQRIGERMPGGMPERASDGNFIFSRGNHAGRIAPCTLRVYKAEIVGERSRIGAKLRRRSYEKPKFGSADKKYTG